MINLRDMSSERVANAAGGGGTPVTGSPPASAYPWLSDDEDSFGDDSAFAEFYGSLRAGPNGEGEGEADPATITSRTSIAM